MTSSPPRGWALPHAAELERVAALVAHAFALDAAELRGQSARRERFMASDLPRQIATYLAMTRTRAPRRDVAAFFEITRRAAGNRMERMRLRIAEKPEVARIVAQLEKQLEQENTR